MGRSPGCRPLPGRNVRSTALVMGGLFSSFLPFTSSLFCFSFFVLFFFFSKPYAHLRHSLKVGKRVLAAFWCFEVRNTTKRECIFKESRECIFKEK